MAKGILQNLINKLISNGRVLYVLASSISFLAILGLGIILMHLLSFHHFHDEFCLMVKIFILGSLGGLISVLIKIRDIALDPQSEMINKLSGISRVIIAGTASIIFYFGYKSDILFSFTKGDKSTEIYFIWLFSFFMGFSERIIPDFSNRINGLLKQE
jgi:hypothetical protein